MPGKPVVLVVDDNPDVLTVIEDDLRSRISEHYQVLTARSGATGLDQLRSAEQRGDPVALVLADQRMPRTTGREVLAAVPDLASRAKRLLLVSREDVEIGVQAINAGQTDDFLLKPWEAAEERAYPLIADLLEAWRGETSLTVDGIQVIGSRWSPACHRLRDFLSHNLVSHRWLDVETEQGRRFADRLAPGQTHEVLVTFPDGTILSDPTSATLAEKIGMPTRAAGTFHDLVIVGAGPAGLAAAVYATSEGLRTALVECEAPGGQAGTSSRIENYLGFPAGLSGSDLTRRAVAQARRFGTEFLTAQNAIGLRTQDRYHIVTLEDGSELRCHALVIATGVSYRMLDVPGGALLNGAGVYYGSATTEAFSVRDEDIYIVGGANSAGQAAVYLAAFARSVTMLVRGPSLSVTMSSYLIDQLDRLPNVTVRANTEVIEVHGSGHLEAVTVHNGVTGATETLAGTALFVFIGATPRTDWLEGMVARDAYGFILTGPDLQQVAGQAPRAEAREPYLLETSVPGIFAAGDVRHDSMKRVAAAVGEGATAVAFVHQYLATL